MAEIICCNCKKPFDETGLIQCPHCDAPIGEITVFQKLIQKDETETKKIVSKRIGTRSSKGAEDMLNLEEEGCDVEFRYRMNKGNNCQKGSFSEKIFKLLILLFFSCTPSTLFAYSYVQVEGYLAADSVYNTAWKRNVPVYIIPYNVSSITVYPKPFISGYGAHISKLSLQGDNSKKIIDLTGNISFYSIDMSKVPFNFNCFLYIKAVSGYNPSAIDEICYIRRIARDNPSHQQLRLSVSTTTSRYWECSKDGGTTWNVLPNSNKTYYTEENPEKGTALYRDLKEDGNYSDILTINYYDIVPSNIVASPSTITKTVDESTTFSVNVEDDGYTYQWMHNDIAIEGATSKKYTIEKIKAKDAGNYYCVVSNPVSSTNSSIVSLSVNKAPQTISFPEIGSRIYGDEDIILPKETDKGQTIYYQSTNTAVAEVKDNVLTIKGVGQTNIIASQSGSDDYQPATTITRALTVNKISQTIAFNELPIKTYEDQPFALLATSSHGLPIIFESTNPEVVTISGQTATIVGAGTTEIIASQSGDNTHYAATSVSQTLTVNKCAQVITFGTLETQVYGATPITLNKATDKNLIIDYTSSNNDVASVNGNVITIKHPGTTTITASQGGNANYLPATNIQQTLTVIKAQQSIPLSNIPSTKYGSTDIELPTQTDKGLDISYRTEDETIATIVNGHYLHIVGAGTTNVICEQEGNEYYEPSNTLTLSFTVEKAYQTIVFEELPTYIYGVEPQSLNARTNSSSVIRYASSNENIATVQNGTLTISGAGECYITAYADADNNYYSATPVQRLLKVNKASQTIVFPTIEDKIYGDNPFTLTATSNRNLPIAYTSSNPSVISINGNTATIKGAGSTTLTACQEGTSNYESSQSVISVTINKAPLVLKADNKERMYGEGNPSFTISFDGFKNGDTKEDLYTLPRAYCEASAATPIGQYDIVISEVTDNNYEIQYQNGKLTISKAPLTVKAENAEKEYGERNPNFRIVYQGFKNGESEVVLLNKPSVSTIAKTMSEVGFYPIVVEGGEARNYYFVYEESILQITKAPLMVILFDVKREYGDEKTAEIRYVGFKGDDNVDNLDVLPTVKTSTNTYTSVGTYEMVLLGGNDKNYDYVFDYNGKACAEIIIYKASLSVKADDKVYSLGDGIFPNFSMSFDGFKNGDTKDDIDEWPKIYCEADKTYPEGEYVIALTGGNDNNYELVLQNGKLIISNNSTSINNIEDGNETSEVRVYNSFGQFVRKIGINEINQLPKILPNGVYIIKGKKFYVK